MTELLDIDSFRLELIRLIANFLRGPYHWRGDKVAELEVLSA